MKKQLFTIFSALSAATLVAQVASPEWSTLQSPSFPIPVAGHRYMDAVDPNVAWVSGYDGQAPGLNYNFVSKTNNAGTTWTVGDVFADTNTWALANLEGLDANTAWVTAYNKVSGGSGVIYRTTNAGGTWTNMTPPGMFTNTAAFGNWIAFLTPSVAVVNGDPVNGEFELWRTTDGGATFTQVPGTSIPNPQTTPNAEFAIVDMYATHGPNHIWFGTNQGRVYRSFDAGVTWSVSSVTGVTSPTSSVIEIDFVSPTKGLCLMVVGGTSVLYNTFDGGVTWTALPAGGMNSLPDNYGANEMQPVPGTEIFVSAGNGNGVTAFGGLSYSRDNGVTWTDWGSTGIGYVTIDFSDRWTGWAGSFTNFPDNNWPGIFKYEGNTFNSLFSIPSAICLTGSSATISPVNNSASPDGPLTFNWTSNPPAQFSSPSASVPLITFTNVGTYTITLAATDPDGTGTMTQVIQVASCAAPQASFSIPNKGCNNQFLTLQNQSTGGPTPSVNVVVSPIGQATVSAPAGNQYSILFGNPGIYTITMNAASISGSATATKTVEIEDCRPTGSLGFNADTLCRFDTLETVYTLNGTVLSYTWSIQPIQGLTHTVDISGAYPNVPNKRVIFSKDPATYPLTTYTITLYVGNQSGVTQYVRVVNVTADNCTAIDENDALSRQVIAFPNPATDWLAVTLPTGYADYSVKVFNLLGELVHQQKMRPGENKIDVGKFQKGVYFIEVNADRAKAGLKFIVD